MHTDLEYSKGLDSTTSQPRAQKLYSAYTHLAKVRFTVLSLYHHLSNRKMLKYTLSTTDYVVLIS